MVSCGFYHHLVSWIYLIWGGWTRQRKDGITEKQVVGLVWGHNLPVDANIQPCFQHFLKFNKLTVPAIKVAKQHIQQPNKLHHAGMIMKISLYNLLQALSQWWRSRGRVGDERISDERDLAVRGKERAGSLVTCPSLPGPACCQPAFSIFPTDREPVLLQSLEGKYEEWIWVTKENIKSQVNDMP